jgi:uroporphyrinogen decarboxylase
VGGIWWVWDQQEPDWFKMDLPTSPLKAKGFGSFETFYDNVARLADESDKYLLATIYGSHFEKAYFARGIENFLADMASEPEFARKLLQRVVDYNMTMLDLLLSAPGIDGVLLGSDWGTQLDLLMSPDVWDEMVEMGLDVLNPIQPECMSLEWLHEEFGDDLAYYGGITTQTVLPFGNPDEVRAEARRVRDLLGNGGTGGGYIFAPSQDLQDDVPAENMLALLEVAKEIP